MTTRTSEPAIDPTRLREVMGRFATGVTIISTAAGGRVHGMTVNAFMSGSLEPPLCLVSIGRKTRMHGHLRESGHFAVNMLAADQERFARHFSGHPVAGLEVPFERIGNTPVLAGALSTVAAEIVAAHPCGDHTLFVGKIFHMQAREGDPLLFYGGRYGNLARPPAGKPLAEPEIW